MLLFFFVEKDLELTDSFNKIEICLFTVGSLGNTKRFILDGGNFQNRSFRTPSYFGGRGYGRNESRNINKLPSQPRSNGGTYTEYRRVDRSRG